MGSCPVSSPQSLFKALNKQGPLHHAKQENELSCVLGSREIQIPGPFTLSTQPLQTLRYSQYAPTNLKHHNGR